MGLLDLLFGKSPVGTYTVGAGRLSAPGSKHPDLPRVCSEYYTGLVRTPSGRQLRFIDGIRVDLETGKPL